MHIKICDMHPSEAQVVLWKSERAEKCKVREEGG